MPMQHSAYSASRAQPYPPQSSSRSAAASSSKTKTDCVKRPPNAFILFRSWYILHGHPKTDKRQRGISRKAAEVWNTMSDEDKRPFEHDAQVLLIKFKQDNPNFRWNNTPASPSSPSPSTRSSSTSSTSSSKSHQATPAQDPHSAHDETAGSSHENGPRLSHDDTYFSTPPCAYPEREADEIASDAYYAQLFQYAIRPHRRAAAESLFLSGNDGY
ncbi:hypothetical protein BD626DRAFT_631816 [Schizophyllum amplum]|uniref:HMG box domain-containing protein n=1 Tax=Schizophyllum amplum TaxID=97359 RepID=A0A550C9B5_9AGAR|nr:hypothetical protein BD626DRAFT_631816 [Auriculariopsis ampla]